MVCFPLLKFMLDVMYSVTIFWLPGASSMGTERGEEAEEGECVVKSCELGRE